MPDLFDGSHVGESPVLSLLDRNYELSVVRLLPQMQVQIFLFLGPLLSLATVDSENVCPPTLTPHTGEAPALISASEKTLYIKLTLGCFRKSRRAPPNTHTHTLPQYTGPTNKEEHVVGLCDELLKQPRHRFQPHFCRDLSTDRRSTGQLHCAALVRPSPVLLGAVPVLVQPVPLSLLRFFVLRRLVKVAARHHSTEHSYEWASVNSTHTHTTHSRTQAHTHTNGDTDGDARYTTHHQCSNTAQSRN